MNRKKTQRLYREEGLSVRRRRGRKRATGTRAPILVEAKANARWSIDFVHDQFGSGRRFRVLNVIDDVTKECLAAIPDTSISGRRVERELDAIIAWRGKPGLIVSDHGSCYVAHETRRFARDIGLEPLTTPVESPQSNGMAEAFVRTFKRDYVAVNPKPDAATVIAALPRWFDHYNALHPHRALGYRSPREFISSRANETTVVIASEN